MTLAAVAFAGAAAAHPLAPALLELRDEGGGLVTLRFKRPRTQLAGPRPEVRLPEGCTRLAAEAAWGEAGSRIETSRLRCEPPGLAGRWIEVAGLESAEAGVVVRVVRADGASVRGLLTAASPRFRVPEHESAWAVLQGYARLGFDHILAGLDHLLFVLGLVFLAGGGRRLLLTVSAFTVGHSVTLALAALGIVRLAPGPVEVGIAASLLYLAVELTRPVADRARGATDRSGRVIDRSGRVTAGARGGGASAPLAAGFGLLHGLGFAGALQAAGLPSGAVPLALLGFNVGIEIGQLAFVALLLAAGAAARAALGARSETLAHPARVASAYALGVVAAYWVFERLANLA
ncbi:MAG TPA: HupE/UreJ family protein [Myxococcota bacterium]|nr:HupE/UreJ family protein [Myxococcota bacterium]